MADFLMPLTLYDMERPSLPYQLSYKYSIARNQIRSSILSITILSFQKYVMPLIELSNLASDKPTNTDMAGYVINEKLTLIVV